MLPLKIIYAVLLIDCLFVFIGKGYETKSYAVLVIGGYDVDG